MKISCIRILEFDAAHRVVNHESKCATLHGHRYKVEIHARAKDGCTALDPIGRVIDFSVLKDKIGKWIDERWDHNSIIYFEDERTLKALQSMPRKKDPYIAAFNPTAENMAWFLLHHVCRYELSDTKVEAWKVVVWETPNCFAEAVLDV